MSTINNELIDKAIELIKNGNKVQAREILKQAIRDDPKNIRAWYLLGQVVENQDQAIYCLEKVLEFDPTNLKAAEKLQIIKRSPIVTNQILNQPQPEKQPQKIVVVQEKKKNNLITFFAALALVIIICMCVGALLSSNNGGGGGGIFTSNDHQIIYKISGTAKSASLTYENAQGGTEQLSNVFLPWENNFSISESSFLYVSAQNNDDHGTITCEILVDNKSFKTSTSSGAYVIATCSDWYIP